MDIEQNPSPSNHINLQENASVLLQGSIYQGDEIFSLDSRGRQCLPCCLVFWWKLYRKGSVPTCGMLTTWMKFCLQEINYTSMQKRIPRHIMTIKSHVICHLIFHLTTSIIAGKWKKKKKKKKKKKNIFRKFKYHILSGIFFPWFRDSTRYDFLIQPICSLHLQRLFHCIIGTRWLFLPFWLTCKRFRWNAKC